MLRSLYPALLMAAIAGPALAENPVDIGAAQANGLKKLADTYPAAVPDVAFSDLDGGEHRLSDYQDTALLVNFWATWCAPCREEMPSLDALQAQMGGDDFQVLTIAAGRNAPAAIRKFYDETGIEHLPILTDSKLELARAFGVMGMPVTVLIDREGQEVGRLIGGADWASPAALDAITQLKAP